MSSVKRAHIEVELGPEATDALRGEVQKKAALLFFIEYVRSHTDKKVDASEMRGGLCKYATDMLDEFEPLTVFANALDWVMRPHADSQKKRQAYQTCPCVVSF